jgi:hypothetical protein
MINKLILLSLLVVATILFSFAPKNDAPIPFYYSKVVILQQGSDNFAFDSKKVDTTSGNVNVLGNKVIMGKHKYKLKHYSSDILIAIGYDKTYIFYK